MDDPLLVGGFERLGDLLRDRQRLIDWNRALCNSVSERRPLDQFHDKRLHSVCLLQAIDMGDVRMIEGGEDLRFSPETSEAVRVRRERIRQHLQGIVALERCVVRSPDLAHAALADQGSDLIRAEARTGSQ